MPVLSVHHVPELDGVIWVKITVRERFRVEKPIAQDQCTIGRLRPKLMHHGVIWMQTQQHVWVNRVIENDAEILVAKMFHRRCASVSTHGQTFTFGDAHETAEERSFSQII